MSDVTWHASAVAREDRHGSVCDAGMTIWLTGLPGSGKSTVAMQVEKSLVAAGVAAYTLDADNTRHGLNADLGFSTADRSENVRRLGEVARLMADAGLVVLVSVISPYRVDRDAVRTAHAEADIPFAEVHVETPLEVCEQRDPKGLYARARAGDIPGFTGIDDPYEEPLDPELRIGSPDQPADESARLVLDLITTLTQSP
jgi:bifunctional enzyme CysN/CysC